MDDQLIRDRMAAKEAELQQVVTNFNAGEQQRVQIVNALQQLRTQATHLEGQVTALRELLGEELPGAPALPPEEASAEKTDKAPTKESPIEAPTKEQAPVVAA